MMRASLFFLLTCFATATMAESQPLRAAVAANFAHTLKHLSALYQRQTGMTIHVVTSSTGKLALQIARGAPYDLFFAADMKRPQWLYQQGKVTRPVPYAQGVLVLWQKQGVRPPKQRLRQGDFSRLSIANPKTAPYGRAAQETLQALGLWQQVLPKLVRGENVGQAFQHVYSGNAQLGFVALSQVVQLGQDDNRHSWRVPARLYQPLIQAAVVVKHSPHAAEAHKFLHWVTHAPEARALIQRQGYRLP